MTELDARAGVPLNCIASPLFINIAAAGAIDRKFADIVFPSPSSLSPPSSHLPLPGLAAVAGGPVPPPPQKVYDSGNVPNTQALPPSYNCIAVLSSFA